MVSAVDRLTGIEEKTLSMAERSVTETASGGVGGGEEHVITARRSSDGSLTFDVRISHIIEQTLLRSYNRPNFRKSTIRVLEDSSGDGVDLLGGEGSTKLLRAIEGTAEESSHAEYTSLLPINLQMKRKSPEPNNDSPTTTRPDEKEMSSTVESCASSQLQENDISSREAEIFLKRPCWKTPTANEEGNSDDNGGEAISAIPTSWLLRGISSDEKRQFQRSIANASLCPYECKRISDNSKQLDEQPGVPPKTIYDEDYESDPFSPSPILDPVSPANSWAESAVGTPVSLSTLYIPETNSVTAGNGQPSPCVTPTVKEESYFINTDMVTEDRELPRLSIDGSRSPSPPYDDISTPLEENGLLLPSRTCFQQTSFP